MADVEVTNATRDAAERAASKTAADAEMAKLVEEYHNSPEQRLARDRAELARLESDPFHSNARLTSERAQQDVAAIKSRLAVAEAEAAKLHGPDRIVHALTSDPATDPLSDSTVDGELPMAALRAQVEEFRSLGLSDREITAALMFDDMGFMRSARGSKENFDGYASRSAEIQVWLA